jgi:excisionase family DNA binding protein
VTEPRLDSPLLTAAEVAALLAVPRSSVYEYVRRGDIPHITIGRHLRFERRSLEAWLAAQLNGTASTNLERSQG